MFADTASKAIFASIFSLPWEHNPAHPHSRQRYLRLLFWHIRLEQQSLQ